MITGGYFLKQHKIVECLEYYLDSDLNRERMAVEFLKRLTQS